MTVTLGINHQSPLIHLGRVALAGRMAGNQSPIPFDTLYYGTSGVPFCWESITNPL